jgi:hypothetical protein
MRRIQLHLTDEQDRRLLGLSRKAGVSRAELIRRGIDLVLRDETRNADPLLGLAGAAGPAKRSDISERHDAILYVADSSSPSAGTSRKRGR